MSSRFVYVTYIRTTPEKVWDAITTPEFARQYWFGVALESDWKNGSPWKMVFEDGTVSDDGEVVESDRPKRLVLKWHHRLYPEMQAEGWSRCTFDIADENGLAKLSVVHEIERDNSRVIEGVSGGWPKILSSLKSFLESGQALDIERWRRSPKTYSEKVA
ncbi:MAG: SRPBCC family protein [Bauldia sp.]